MDLSFPQKLVDFSLSTNQHGIGQFKELNTFFHYSILDSLFGLKTDAVILTCMFEPFFNYAS